MTVIRERMLLLINDILHSTLLYKKEESIRTPTLKWFLNMVEKSNKSPLYIDMYLQNKTVNV
jgi:hypothetical protein